MGAIFLLVLADMNEIEHIFARVEWTTLVFFAALFAVMEVSQVLHNICLYFIFFTIYFAKDKPFLF